MTGTPKDGKAGTTDQAPHWEGPEENRPRGYLPAEDDPDRDPDAAGETLRNPDKENLGDSFARKGEKPVRDAQEEAEDDPNIRPVPRPPV